MASVTDTDAVLLDDDNRPLSSLSNNPDGRTPRKDMTKEQLLQIIDEQRDTIKTQNKKIWRQRETIDVLQGTEAEGSGATGKRKKDAGSAPSTLRAYKASLAAAYEKMNFSQRGVITANVAYWTSPENYEDFKELVVRVDSDHDGELIFEARMDVINAMRDVRTVELCNAAVKLGFLSLRGWDRLRRVLFFVRDKQNKNWIPRVLVLPDGTELPLHAPYCGKTLSRFESERFTKLSVSPSDSDDRLSVVFEVDSSLRCGLEKILADCGVDFDVYIRTIAFADGGDETQTCIIVHLSGDAATLQRGVDGTNVILRILHMPDLPDINDDILKSQAPERVIPTNFFIGKDTYEHFALYCWRTFNACRRIAEEGLKVELSDGTVVLIRIVFCAGGDWLFIRTMNGLWCKPFSSHPCPFCEVTLHGLATWPTGDNWPRDRDMERMAQMAHAVLPGSDFKPFRCPGAGCTFKADKIEDIEEGLVEFAKLSATEKHEKRKEHAPTHMGQQLFKPPLWAGIVTMTMVVACLLHLLLNGCETMFEFSAREEASTDEETTADLNVLLVSDKMNLKKCKYVKLKDRKKQTGKRIGSGIIGADCFRMIQDGKDGRRRYRTYMECVWRQREVDFTLDAKNRKKPKCTGAEQKRRREQCEKWIAAWEAFDHLWSSLCEQARARADPVLS